MVKLRFSNIIIDISYKFSNYIQYNHVWKLFEVVCLHQHTAIVLCCLDRNEKLHKIFAYPGNNCTFFRTRTESLKLYLRLMPALSKWVKKTISNFRGHFFLPIKWWKWIIVGQKSTFKSSSNWFIGFFWNHSW